MRPFLFFLNFICLLCLFPEARVSASDFLYKREQLEQNLENGKIDRYDVPFTTYVSLGMWREIDAILKANNRNVVKYSLPKGRYSRPFSVDGEIWVFRETENGAESDGILVFDADSLKLNKILRNERISRYRGGVRSVFGDRILLSGTGRNMGTAAVWHVPSDNWRTFLLPEGNLISGVAVEDSFLFLGGCGGIVNKWRVDSDIDYAKTYPADRSNWSAAKATPEECIQAIAIVDDRMIGVGEANIFYWDRDSATLEVVQPKSIRNSAVYIKDHHMVEFRGQRFSVHDLGSNSENANEGTAGLPILDVGITRDQVLAKQNGDVLVVALTHHQGFLLFELDDFKRIARVQMKSGPFTIHDGRLFVIRDQAIFQYDFRGMAPEAYERFLKTIQLKSIPLTEGVYFQLLKRARIYPDIIPLNLLAEMFFKEKRVSIRHSIVKNPSFKGDNSGNEFHRAGTGETGGSRSTEIPRKAGEFAEYFIDFELINRSDKAISLTLMVQWGNSEEDASISSNNSASDVTWHHLDLAAYGGKAYGRVPVIGGEPKEVYLYPTRLEEVP